MREPGTAWIRLASLLYRLCAHLAPNRFRERFGQESEDTFHHLVEDTLRNRGSGAAITMAAAACGDVARVGVVERASGWRGAVMSGGVNDFTQAIRVYPREPVLAAALMLTLALIVGPVVGVFSLLYHVVLAPVPYPDADRLVVVNAQTPRGRTQFLPVASVADYRGVEAFSMVGGMFPVVNFVATEGAPVRVNSARVTAGLLSGLGVPFAAGRDLIRGEREVIVTRGFALAWFGSEAAAVGRRIVVSRETMPIVGVLAFAPPLPWRTGIELFTPHTNADRAVPARQKSGQAVVIARIKPNLSIDVASEQARAIAVEVRAQFGGSEETPELVPLRTAVSGPLRAPLLILFTAVSVVFLIAVTSLASLVLARAAAHAADIAVRKSLGASRWRLVRSWLIDGAVLALPGVALGIIFGQLLLAYARATLPPGLIPLPETSGLGPMSVAAAGLAVTTSVLFALAPVGAGLLRSPSISLRDATRSIAGLRRVRSQSLLIAGQVALSLVLVASAVWLSTSLWRTFARPVGFDTEGLIIVYTETTHERPVQILLARRVVSRLEQLEAGSASRVAASSSQLPGVNASRYGPVRIRADQPAFTDENQPTLARSAVSTGYFHVLEIPILQGRSFTAEDEGTPDRVVIVSRSFAARWFPDGAIGRVVTFVRDDRREIVGVVEDVHAGRLTDESVPQFYVPMTESSLGTPSNYVIRTMRPVDAVRADVTAMLREIDPTAKITVASAAEAMAMPLTLQRLANKLTLALAGLALVLAVVNVYALSAFAVVQRTREIGIRIALGARSADAIRLVMRRGLVWVSIGLLVGAGVTLLLVAPLLQRQLFETRTSDPSLLAVAVVIVSAVAVLASWLPARRAARIDPAITLRAE